MQAQVHTTIRVMGEGGRRREGEVEAWMHWEGGRALAQRRAWGQSARARAEAGSVAHQHLDGGHVLVDEWPSDLQI